MLAGGGVTSTGQQRRRVSPVLNTAEVQPSSGSLCVHHRKPSCGSVGHSSVAAHHRKVRWPCRTLLHCAAVPGDRVSSSQLAADLSKAVSKATGKPEAVRSRACRSCCWLSNALC